MALSRSAGRLILDEDYWGWGEKPKSFPGQIGRSPVKLAADEAAFVDPECDFFAKSGQWVIDTERFAWPQGIVVAHRPAQIRRLKPMYRVAGTAKGEPPAVPANVSMRRAVAGLSFRLDEIRGILAGAPGHLAVASFEHADDRHIRYLRLAQLLSMLTFENLVFGGGDGRDIKSSIVGSTRGLAAADARGGQRQFHPDAIPAFWVEVAKELKRTQWTLPVIQRQ